jgi:hypothetical protein
MMPIKKTAQGVYESMWSTPDQKPVRPVVKPSS